MLSTEANAIKIFKAICLIRIDFKKNYFPLYILYTVYSVQYTTLYTIQYMLVYVSFLST